MNHNHHEEGRQILGRVKREEFVGRAAELERLVSHGMRPEGPERSGQAGVTRGLLMLLAPLAGVSELLRQAYEELIEAYNQQRFGNDDRELVRFCLTAPSKVPARNGRTFVMFDAVQLAHYTDSIVPLATEIVRALASSRHSFALAGLRREILDAVSRAAI